MDREGFRSRMKQYKKAREGTPGLKYWEWKAQPAEKDIPNYDKGTVSVKEKEDAFWRGDTLKMAELVEREGKQLTYVTPESNLDEVVITANRPKQNQYSELDLAKDIASFTPVGDVIDLYDASKALYKGNYSEAGMLLAGLLLPNWLEKSGKFLSKAYHRIRPSLGDPDISKLKTIPVYHSTRFKLPEELPVEGSELGFHVGTAKAAKERFVKTQGIEKDYSERLVFPHMEEGYIQAIEDNIADTDDLVLFHPSMFKAPSIFGQYRTNDKRIINVLNSPISEDELLDEIGTFRRKLVRNGVDVLRYINRAEDAGNFSYTVLNPNIVHLAKQIQHPYPDWRHLFSDNTKIYGFAEGGEVDSRQLILNRANSVASNYGDAKDFTLNPFNYAVRKIAKTLTGRGGISNCTLSATGWVDPNNQYMSAKNIFNNPDSGYTEISKDYALPGDLLISKVPNKDSYHTMLIEDFDEGNPILRYSRGGHNTKKNLVTGRSLAEYHRLDNAQGGNHTEDHYFRYNLPNEYWLPEIVVTPKK